MLKILLILFVLVPIIELTILFKLGNWLGWLPTLALVFGAGLAGAAIARVQGLRAAMQMRQQLAHGVMPAATVVDGLLIAVAGGLLILPGFISDLAGIALLFPWTRAVVRRGLVRWLQQHFHIQQIGGAEGGEPRPRGDQIIDARVIETRVVD